MNRTEKAAWGKRPAENKWHALECESQQERDEVARVLENAGFQILRGDRKYAERAPPKDDHLVVSAKGLKTEILRVAQIAGW